MIHSGCTSAGLQSASYFAPAGICTVHVNMITSVHDADGSIGPLQCGAMDGAHLHNGISHLTVSLMSDVLVVGLCEI